MELKKLKSIDEASDRDMLNFIYATQLHILRRLDRMEQLPKDKLIPSRNVTIKNMVDTTDDYIKRINDYLREE